MDSNQLSRVQKKIYKGGILIDGTGSAPQKNAVLVAEGNKITYVGKIESAPPMGEDVEIVDLEGLFIMPGLIDAHIHLWGVRTMDYYHRLVVPEYLSVIRATEDVRKLLEAGFTSVRCCGGNKAIHLKKAVEEGTISGPRIVASHLSITQTGGHMDQHFVPLEEVRQKKLKTRIADGPDECRRAAREQFREGADFIKIATTGGIMSQKDTPFECQMTKEEIRAVVEEAERKSSFVAAHAQSSAGVVMAVKAGVKTIEHGLYLDEASCQVMADRDAVLVSTLSISHQLASYGKEHGVPPWGVQKASEGMEAHKRSIKLAFDIGVKVAMGTDYSGGPILLHGENAKELELLVQAGLTPMDAIVSATRNAAEALGMKNETGTLEVGKLADFIAIDGNPLNNISILQRLDKIRFVVKEGRTVVKR